MVVFSLTIIIMITQVRLASKGGIERSEMSLFVCAQNRAIQLPPKPFLGLRKKRDGCSGHYAECRLYGRSKVQLASN